MNLVAFSLRTKGLHNFLRRLWTVFARFGLSERRIAQALRTLITTVQAYDAYPTFFIPAVVLQRHSRLIKALAAEGTEIGIHGYVHNDYRTLSSAEQDRQTRLAMATFQEMEIPFQGFRNPYLGWTEEALGIFAALGFSYESNEAVLHEVIPLETLSPAILLGYKKSLQLFQAIPPGRYTLRPHIEQGLVRLPTSIPDDEMLYDRLRITDPQEIGQIWSNIMYTVYTFGGLYTLNLHPERGMLCKEALDRLLDRASHLPESVWITRLEAIADWWRERSRFRFEITALSAGRWRVQITCSPRAWIESQGLTLEQEEERADAPTDQSATGTPAGQVRRWIVRAARCPCIALSPTTPAAVKDFLHEQGYAVMRASESAAHEYSLYLDLPEGLGLTRQAQRERCSALLEEIERLEAPLLSFACWPAPHRAALAISGDIDSITIQDFFLRIIEVIRPAPRRQA
jgi:peptidoglycan/xylan/chitin deacetylase (PgdA/CDA1 family)